MASGMGPGRCLGSRPSSRVRLALVRQSDIPDYLHVNSMKPLGRNRWFRDNDAYNQRIFDWNDAVVAERHLIERGGSFGQNPARISVGPIHPRCRWSPLLAKEFSRERRRSVKDTRPIFDRDFEFTSFVPNAPWRYSTWRRSGMPRFPQTAAWNSASASISVASPWRQPKHSAEGA